MKYQVITSDAKYQAEFFYHYKNLLIMERLIYSKIFRCIENQRAGQIELGPFHRSCCYVLNKKYQYMVE